MRVRYQCLEVESQGDSFWFPVVLPQGIVSKGGGTAASQLVSRQIKVEKYVWERGMKPTQFLSFTVLFHCVFVSFIPREKDCPDPSSISVLAPATNALVYRRELIRSPQPVCLCRAMHRGRRVACVRVCASACDCGTIRHRAIGFQTRSLIYPLSRPFP